MVQKEKTDETLKIKEEIKKLLPEFIRQNPDFIRELVKQDNGPHGEVGGDILIESGTRKLKLKQQENDIYKVLVLYKPNAERVKNGNYKKEDLDELEDCIKRYRNFRGEKDLLDVERSGLNGILRHIKELRNLTIYEASDREFIYRGFIAMLDSIYIAKHDPNAIADFHLHEDLERPSSYDIHNTIKNKDLIEVVLAHDNFKIVPYMVFRGEVEKLDEINLTPTKKK